MAPRTEASGVMLPKGMRESCEDYEILQDPESIAGGHGQATYESSRGADGAFSRKQLDAAIVAGPDEIRKIGRAHLGRAESPMALMGFSESDLPGVRFSYWMQFKNRYANEDLSGIVVEALVGPPDLRRDLMADDYQRTLANTPGVSRAFVPRLADYNSPGSATDLMIHRVRILSPVVRKRMASLATPETDWSMQPITFMRPFRELITFHEQMTLEVEYAEETASQTIIRGEYKDLSNYVNFVKRVVLPLQSKWDTNSPNLPSKIRSVDLWYIFKPGDLLYVKKSHQTLDRFYQDRRPSNRTFPPVCMLLSNSVDIDKEYLSDSVSRQLYSATYRDHQLKCIHLDFDGRAFRPVVDNWMLSDYDGEKEIRSLEIYPLKFEPDADKIVAEYRHYGEQFTTFCSSQRHWFHSGWTVEWRPSGPLPHGTREDIRKWDSEFIDSEVIVDFQEALRSFAGWSPTFLAPISSERKPSVETTTDMWSILTWGDRDSTVVKSSTTETVVVDSGLDVEDQGSMAAQHPMLARGSAQVEDLDPTHLSLLPRRVFAYSLRDRKFVLAHVDSLSKVKTVNGGFQNLRINDTHLRMIKSLVKNHFNTKQLEAAEGMEVTGQDFIYGKGRGVVVLLHGVPGVGKTATAEAVAQEYSKPLFAMTCGDLGTTPEGVSWNLMNIFRLANLWDCVLLLDEADVFLSRREQRGNDLLRNALVSVFLRVLEYYNGILFLTTNRPGTLDEAVKSRVHASFFYPHLAWHQTRDIFGLNIERLRRMEEQRAKCGEKSLVILDNQIMKFAEDHFHRHTDYEGRWNGRQIRNAFQIAAGLAHLDGEEGEEAAAKAGGGTGTRPADVQRQLGRQHFQDVADAILAYDQFRASALGKFDDEFAKDRMERPDGWREARMEPPGGYGYGGASTRGDYPRGMGPYERSGARHDGGGGHGNFSGHSQAAGDWTQQQHGRFGTAGERFEEGSARGGYSRDGPDVTSQLPGHMLGRGSGDLPPRVSELSFPPGSRDTGYGTSLSDWPEHASSYGQK